MSSLDDDDESSDDDLEVTVDDVDGDNIQPGEESVVIEPQILKSKVYSLGYKCVLFFLVFNLKLKEIMDILDRDL